MNCKIDATKHTKEELYHYSYKFPQHWKYYINFVKIDAELADIILPSAAFTEQDGFYTNLEGVMQKAYKASYPPGEAKEDWQVINELSKYISSKNLYDSKESLEKNMTNYLNLHNSKNNNSTKFENNFTKEKIFIKDIDYYYSNAIARASKTMSECRKEKINLKSTGTEG